MNRPIKFRAWNPQGDMLAPWELGDGTTNEKLIREENWTIMQFTGLKDKNGKEIYEGDILCINDDESAPKDVVRDITETLHLKGFISRGIPVEVIGNIYENPELLSN